MTDAVQAVLRSVLAGAVGEVLAAAVGRDAELSEVTAIVGMPGATAQALHADACWSAGSPRTVTTFLALHDILDETMGPTYFSPGTHVPRCFPAGVWLPPPDAYTRPNPTATEKLASSPPIWYELGAGDATPMESTTWHLGGANTSDRRRHLLTFTFVAPKSGKSPPGPTGKPRREPKQRLASFLADNTTSPM